MTTRFVTVGDDLTLPASVVVPADQVDGELRAEQVRGLAPVATTGQVADLADVDTTGLADGDAMVWDQASGKWVRVSLPSTYAALPTGTPDGTKYYRDDGTWATPPGSGGSTVGFVDNGDGTFTLSSDTALVDNLDGTYTLTV